ncbi:S-methyl-5-thioribose-1-phosphate isomerase [Rhodovulum sp. DZ06]|uniref:S-methyl-5-thioribose-1-phosphate isomerase n=1 Tax=Rhodovulum sp. DZ06 TaxID=3425126 RepID=UPI003D33F122
MKVDGVPMRTIWPAGDGPGQGVEIIDQTRLPHRLTTVRLMDIGQAAHAIRAMLVRGAPLIGATAAYGVALEMARDPSDAALAAAVEQLGATRPTAINLMWALERMRAKLARAAPGDRAEIAWAEAAALCDEDVEINQAIGRAALPLIEAIAEAKGGAPVNILTHCNAGWLATVDWGTATAPIYMAHDAGIPLHVWVDETRPRLQGAALTAWELGRHGVPHAVIPDNSGGHLMRRGEVDICFVGTDRTTANGDVCNKIGTYLKALAAADNGVPFYVCLPSPTIDFTLASGDEIPIEERAPEEVTHIPGVTPEGVETTVRITPEGAPARNHGFDVTPARLVTGLATERGLVAATKEALAAAFPERAG